MATDHGQFNRAQIVDGQFFKARGHCAGLLEPTDAAFNDIATKVLSSIEDWWPSSTVPDLVQSLGNDSAHVMSSQPLTDATMAICAIPSYLLGTPPAMRPMDAYGIEHGFCI